MVSPILTQLLAYKSGSALANNFNVMDVSSSVSSTSSSLFELSFAGGNGLMIAIAIFVIAVGAILCLFGARLFRLCVWLLSFLFIAGIVFYIVTVTTGSSTAGFIAGICTGVVVAWFITLLWELCLLAIGAAVGFVLWLGFRSVFPHAITSDAGLYILLAASCVVFAALVFLLAPILLIPATAILGAFLICEGVAYFTGQDMNVFHTVHGDAFCNTSSCYAVYAAFLGAAIVGILFQTCVLVLCWPIVEGEWISSGRNVEGESFGFCGLCGPRPVAAGVNAPYASEYGGYGLCNPCCAPCCGPTKADNLDYAGAAPVAGRGGPATASNYYV